MQEIKVGQIWREVDPRFNRYVQIVEIANSTVKSICVATIDIQTNALGRKNWASRERFNGKRGGYELHKDART
jgi:DNA-binding IscR family transcriptional regulator